MIDAEVLRRQALLLVIGDVDTGKTTLCRRLAETALERGWTVGLVDADVGQSWIGPPTTVGMKMLARSLDLDPPDAIHFVGAISPEHHIPEMLVGVRRMVDRCWQEGADVVIVDTTGFVRGPAAVRLKTFKIELLQPQTVLAIEQAGELAPLLHQYRDVDRPEIHILPRSREVRRKSPSQRRTYRNERLRTYFQEARVLTFEFDSVNLRGWPFGKGRPASSSELEFLARLASVPTLYAEWGPQVVMMVSELPLSPLQRQQIRSYLSCATVISVAPEQYAHRVVGLSDRHGETLGLGIIQEVDWATRCLSVWTPVPRERIRTVSIGSYPWEPTGESGGG